MSKNYRWLLLPPAVALLIVLGPLSMARKESPTSTTVAVEAPVTKSGRDVAAIPAVGTTANLSEGRPALPRTPDLWQVTSTLVGLLLLGGAGLFLLRRMHTGGGKKSHGAIALRQSVRLSARQALHAVEFDGKLLLVGEGERGMTLLAAGTPPEHAADEALIAARTVAAEPEEEGAVPKNLVIPRPAAVAAARSAKPSEAAAAETKPRPSLGDFRALLAQATKQ